MKFNELFTADNGIFAQVFKTDFPDLYTTCFGSVEPVMIDRWAWIKYGGRELLETVTADTYKNFVSSVIAVNADKWTNVAELLAKKYDCLNPTVKTVTTTKTATTATTEANENINAQKAFNDEQFNDGQRNQTNGTGSRQDDESTTSTENGLGGGTIYSTVIQKEKALRQDEYKRTVVAELVDEITLNIYK
jgi:hypothetical protein